MANTSKIGLLVNNIVNNHNLYHLLLNLSDRWDDEREYEDFKEYEEVIKKEVLECYPEITFKKATKRPMGFIMSVYYYKSDISVYLKVKAGCAWLVAKSSPA